MRRTISTHPFHFRLFNPRFSLLTSHFLFLIFCFLLLSCSSKHKESHKKASQAQDSLAHDSYSAPLHSAAEKASAADFETELINGKIFRLSEQKGKIVVLNIWATWCPPCEEETPALEEVYQKYKLQKVIFLGISIDEQGPSVVKPFIKKHQVSYPITIDDGTIMDKYGPLMGIPTTYVIDGNGNLKYFATGAITKKELEPRLEKLLNARH